MQPSSVLLQGLLMLAACIKMDWGREVVRAADMAGGGDEAGALEAPGPGAADQVRLPRLRRPSFSGPIVVVPGVFPQAEHAHTVPEESAPV